jgi:hypothetical protein
MVFINATLEWYKSVSAQYNLTPRCPFANIYKCPKYFDSLYLLEGTGTTSINEQDIKELDKYWEGKKLKFGLKEEKPGISKSNDKFSCLTNFCPEVTFLRFGYFASHLSEFADEIDKDIRYTELEKRKIDKDDWRWYFQYFTPQHYTDCLEYSLLKHDTVIKDKININLSNKQEKDREKFGYKCKDQIYIPGTNSFYRSDEIIVNRNKIKIGDSLFLLLLRLVVELKKGEGGWVNIHSLCDEHNIANPDKYQIYSNLRTVLQGSLINKNAKEFIENDGSKNYRIPTHPVFITYNKEKLLSHKGPDIRKLAEELPKNK